MSSGSAVSDIPMAAVVNGTRSSWQAVAPLGKMKLARFLIYDFRIDGVCGLSPTLVRIWPGQDYSETASGNSAHSC